MSTTPVKIETNGDGGAHWQPERAWILCYEWTGDARGPFRRNVICRGIHPLEWLARQPVVSSMTDAGARRHEPNHTVLLWYAEIDPDRIKPLQQRTTIAIERPQK